MNSVFVLERKNFFATFLIRKMLIKKIKFCCLGIHLTFTSMTKRLDCFTKVRNDDFFLSFCQWRFIVLSEGTAELDFVLIDNTDFLKILKIDYLDLIIFFFDIAFFLFDDSTGNPRRCKCLASRKKSIGKSLIVLNKKI
jgi:hypothetical protein